jgi:hypothetical protein
MTSGGMPNCAAGGVAHQYFGTGYQQHQTDDQVDKGHQLLQGPVKRALV